MLYISAIAQNGLTPGQVDRLRALVYNEFEQVVEDPRTIEVSNQLVRYGFSFKLLQGGDQLYAELKNRPEGSFAVKSFGKSVTFSSLTYTGLQNALYWYLFKLGFRYYFPHSAWTIKPKLESFLLDINEVVSPDYDSRRIWYAYGTDSKKADADYNHWTSANLLGGSPMDAGHIYEAIVNRNKEEFLQHPEYFAAAVSKGTIPKNPKFDVSNSALVQLVVADAIRRIQEYEQKNGNLPPVISMEPSDGGGFSTKAGALKIGGPSEQAFYLANCVAKELQKRYPTVKVGMYAYNQHAAPPSFPVERNIIVLLATAYNQTDYRIDELLKRWKSKGVEIGIRDYLGVMAWDWDMPGRPRGARLSYVEQIKGYFDAGARYYSAETNIGWISRGLGHYAAAQLLWNRKIDLTEMKNEFYELCFKSAGSIMKTLYEDWERYPRDVPLEGDLARWIQLVNRAAERESDPEVQARIYQIKKYLHYVRLYMVWENAKNESSLVDMLSYAYAVKDDGIVASYPLARRLANAEVKDRPNLRFNNPNAVWKSLKSISNTEIDNLLRKDLLNLDLNEKTVATVMPELNAELSTTIPLLKGESSPISPEIKLRGTHYIVVQISRKEAANGLKLYQGIIKSKNWKSHILKVYPYRKDISFNNDDLIFEKSIEPKKDSRVDLSELATGSYLFVFNDAKLGFRFQFEGQIKFGILSDVRHSIQTFGRNELFFRVNKGISSFKFENEGAATLVSPTGRTIDLQNKKGSFNISVGNDESGFWKIQKQSGAFILSGVTAWVNPSDRFLLQTQ